MSPVAIDSIMELLLLFVSDLFTIVIVCTFAGKIAIGGVEHVNLTEPYLLQPDNNAEENSRSKMCVFIFFVRLDWLNKCNKKAETFAFGFKGFTAGIL
jgi:hypothetical protein